MQVEPGQSNVFDVVGISLEVGEAWCDEGLIDGVLDSVRSRFVGHGRDEVMRSVEPSELPVGRTHPAR